MKRFMSSAASSSSARAEPATTSLGSAEQPGTRCQLKLSSIRDVQRWLAMEPIASCSSADMQRIREAVAVLVPAKPRQEDVQPLQSKWLVAQQRNKKRRTSNTNNSKNKSINLVQNLMDTPGSEMRCPLSFVMLCYSQLQWLPSACTGMLVSALRRRHSEDVSLQGSEGEGCKGEEG